MSRPIKHSFSIKGHATSISLEPPFWDALQDVARAESTSVAALVGRIDGQRDASEGLSSAVRLYLLAYFRSRSSTG